MAITRHAVCSEAEISYILSLARRMPLSCRHVIDLPWRLSSPATYDGRNAVLWQDATGRVLGFAAWQSPWAVLDFFILPSAQLSFVENELFAWADERFRELDEERGQPLPYWAEFRADDQTRRQMIEAHGFLFEEHDCYVSLQRTLIDLPPVPALPDGFCLRSLRGEPEAALYSEVHRAAFDSTVMTPEWRKRTMRNPRYRPDLDLVICASDGSFAGFCVGWFVPALRVAQIEPFGVHPYFRRHGLGRVMLLEMLHRFKEHGADYAIVETDVENMAARQVYESVGFQTTHTIRRKGKWMNAVS
jgi:Acetyltransferases